jgi:hypothetical protein
VLGLPVLFEGTQVELTTPRGDQLGKESKISGPGSPFHPLILLNIRQMAKYS